jgi:carboxyl-terminal processing protease
LSSTCAATAVAYLAEAIELAGLFIQKGPIVQVKEFHGEIHVDKRQGPRIAYTGPLAVLVDRFSASASEIVTGALQNYGRAIVVGDSSTHGKGIRATGDRNETTLDPARLSPQKTGAAKFTIQKYYLPSGASTQLKGVVPDIVLPSIEDHLPIGEADLPRALVWDQIPTSFFDGQPLEGKVREPLVKASTERQASLPEFAYLRKIVDRFKLRQEQKLISLNLEERRKQKEEDVAFRKEVKLEKEQIARSDFPFKPFYLGPPPPPKIKAPKKDEDEDDAADFGDDENETYVKADVHLREALRVVSDAIALGRNQAMWVQNRPPLTAVSATGAAPGATKPQG